MALRQPGYFAAVAEELSLRRPAEGLFIVQPSLYVRIVEPESDADADGLLDPSIDLQPQTPDIGATSGAWGMSASRRMSMKAIAVYPGKPHSMHLQEVPMPRLTDIPDGRGVLVRVLRVGVDGTDREISEAKYGQAPAGYDFLITGHESLGQVVEAGPNVPSMLRPGTYVVATVRRPGHSL